MGAPPQPSSHRERGVALIIVLAFVVLLTLLGLAYFTRTTSDRQVAHSSFNQSKADQVAASGMDLIIGGLRQEITGPAPTPTPPYFPLPMQTCFRCVAAIRPLLAASIQFPI